MPLGHLDEMRYRRLHSFGNGARSEETRHRLGVGGDAGRTPQRSAELVDHIGVPVQHEGVVGDGHDLDHEVVFGAPAVGVEEMREDRIGCERVGERLDRRLAIAGSRVPREAHAKPRRGSSGGRRSQLSAG